MKEIRMTNPTGAMVALITPFKDGKLDKTTYESLIKRQIELKNRCDSSGRNNRRECDFKS